MVPPLTFAQAADLHEHSLLAVCERVALTGAATTLVVTPDDSVDEMRDLAGSCVRTVESQGPGNLGQRLARSVSREIGCGTEAVILLGADSPDLPTEILANAIRQTSLFDMVLGPCDDGGYYLLGLRKDVAELFDQIDWGGDQVAEQTRQRAETLGLSWTELEPWYDLDRVDDLRRFARVVARDRLRAKVKPMMAELIRFVENLLVEVDK